MCGIGVRPAAVVIDDEVFRRNDGQHFSDDGHLVMAVTLSLTIVTMVWM